MLLPTSKKESPELKDHFGLEIQDSRVFLLNVRKTKTIQCGERILVLPFVSCPGSPLCPYQALNNLLMVTPKSMSVPLFSYKQRGKVVSWTHSSFTRKLKTLVSKAGFDPSLYSGHSFRRGGATLGFELGLSIPEIKQRGDWKSNAVNDYVVVRDVTHTAKTLVYGASGKL